MRKFGMLLIAGLAVCGANAMADPAPTTTESTPAAAAPAEPAASDLDKVVCRNLATTGTRLGNHRVCRTQREWEDIRLQSAKETSKMQGTAMAPRGN